MNNTSRQIFKGELQANTVILPGGSVRGTSSLGSYGRQVDAGIKLTLVEAAYLLYRNRIQVFEGETPLDFESFFKLASLREEHFEIKYIVYKDLRERGYSVQPAVTDFRMYPRGGQPGKTPSRYLVHALSEREKTPLRDLIKHAETADNLKKRLVLAIVDEESDITFYELRKSDPAGTSTTALPGGADATFIEDRTILWDTEFSRKLHQDGFYGKFLDESRLQLSLVETAYLLKQGVITLYDACGEAIECGDFMRIAGSIEPEFPLKYASYEDLRQRNLVPKTGFKFGAHFRLYKTYTTPDAAVHSEYLLHALPFNHEFSLPDFSRAARLAHSVRKHIIYAAVDLVQHRIAYLEVRRIKL